MAKWIALLRGINVGGHNKLAMADLRSTLQTAGLDEVRTYIQSGNVVFQRAGTDAPELTDLIANAIHSEYGLSPRVIVLNADEFMKAAAANPFAGAANAEKTVHLFFLKGAAAGATAPAPDLAKIQGAAGPNERFDVTEKVFYLHTPDGFAKSRLAERIERLLGVEATARNWRTVNRLIELANS